MGKYGIFFVCIGLVCPLFAQQTQQVGPGTQVSAPASSAKSALAATRLDNQLNETLLHRSVLDYTLPPDIASVVQKCVQGDSDECYVALKTFENATDSHVAAAANVELALLAQQRGLMKQALAYIEKAVSLSPDDPFIQLSKGWLLLSAGKYKKARKAFEDLFYLTADF